jgi:hypothetical protein
MVHILARLMMIESTTALLEANAGELVKRARESHVQSAAFLDATERHAKATAEHARSVSQFLADLQPVHQSGNGSANGRAEHGSQDDIPTSDERGRHDDG